MSYTTGTTHYNLPQTVGSDKRDWTDTNEAFSDVDAALWEAHQGATQAALDIASINSEIQTITGKQADDEADIATISAKVSTLETTVANHTTEIGDVRRDLQDNIESLREDTATSTHAYEIGDYFYYNDVLFKATAQIAIGATIVPNTNCTGVTVMDELKNGGAGSVAAEDVSYDNTTSGLTANDVQEAIDEVAAMIGSGGALTTLWTNPNVDATFAAQTVNLSSDNYDILIVNCKVSPSAVVGMTANIVVKNVDGHLSIFRTASGGATVADRTVTFTSATALTFSDANESTGTGAGALANDRCIPAVIYGIKF